MALRFGYVDAPATAPAESDYPLATLPAPVWASANDAYVRAGMSKGPSDGSATAAPFILSNTHGIAVLGHAETYTEPDPQPAAPQVIEGCAREQPMPKAG